MQATTKDKFHVKLGKQASVYFVGLIFGKGLLFALQIVLGRWLGAAGYGLYSLGYSIVLVLQWLGTGGMDWGVLRYCALYRVEGSPEKVKGTIKAALLLALPLSSAVAVIIAASSGYVATRFFSDARLAPVLRMFALSIPLLVLVRISVSFVQSHQEVLRMTMIQHVWQPAWNFAFVAVVFVLGGRVMGAVGAFLASLAATAVLGVYYIRRTFPELFSSLRAQSTLLALLRYSVALTLIGITYQMVLRTPNLLLGHLSTAQSVGLYTVGANFAMAMAVFPTAFALPFMPMMVELYETKDTGQLQNVYRTVTRWTLNAVLPIFLLLSVFRHEMMMLVGREYSQGAPVLVYLSVAWLAYFAKGPGAPLLDMTGRQKIDLSNMLVIEVVVVGLDFALIPRYGANGAAFGTAAAMVFWAGLEAAEIGLLYRIFPWNTGIVRLALPAFLAGAAGYFLKQHLVWPVALVVAAAIYALPFLAFCIEAEDRELIRAILGEVRQVLSRQSELRG